MRTTSFSALVAIVATLLVGSGCGTAPTAPDASLQTAAVNDSRATYGLYGTMSKADRGGMIWADDQLFGTIGTPAHFKPTSGPFDELYNTGGNGTFKDGVAAISESKPGDQDFNGGRWHVNLLKESVDPNKYAEASSVEDLDPDDFVSTDVYFECPLLPRKK